MPELATASPFPGSQQVVKDPKVSDALLSSPAFPGEGPGGRLALTPGATSGGRTLSPPEDCEQSYQHFQGPLSREMVPRDQMDHQAL